MTHRNQIRTQISKPQLKIRNVTIAPPSSEYLDEALVRRWREEEGKPDVLGWALLAICLAVCTWAMSVAIAG